MYRYFIFIFIFIQSSLLAQTKIGGSGDDEIIKQSEYFFKTLEKIIRSNVKRCKLAVNEPVESFQSLLKYLVDEDMKQKLTEIGDIRNPVIDYRNCSACYDQMAKSSKLSCLLKGIGSYDVKYIQNLRTDEKLIKKIGLSNDEILYLKYIIKNLASDE
jgi:hypothetical protein